MRSAIPRGVALPARTELTARKKILVVDDSRTVLLVEQGLLSRTYDVLTATDGVEGLHAALDHRPDLILLDVVMPRMSGLQALAALRAREETRDIPVILVTSRGELESVEAGYRGGASEYVLKPIHAAELLAKVRSCLGA